MDCRTCLQELEKAHHLSDERIARYIHGSLHGSLLARTDEHLRECGFCRWYQEDVEETRRFRDTGAPAAEGEEIPAHLTEGEVYGYAWGVLDDEDQEQVEAPGGNPRL